MSVEVSEQVVQALNFTRLMRAAIVAEGPQEWAGSPGFIDRLEVSQYFGTPAMFVEETLRRRPPTVAFRGLQADKVGEWSGPAIGPARQWVKPMVDTALGGSTIRLEVTIAVRGEGRVASAWAQVAHEVVKFRWRRYLKGLRSEVAKAVLR